MTEFVKEDYNQGFAGENTTYVRPSDGMRIRVDGCFGLMEPMHTKIVELPSLKVLLEIEGEYLSGDEALERFEFL